LFTLFVLVVFVALFRLLGVSGPTQGDVSAVVLGFLGRGVGGVGLFFGGGVRIQWCFVGFLSAVGLARAGGKGNAPQHRRQGGEERVSAHRRLSNERGEGGSVDGPRLLDRKSTRL